MAQNKVKAIALEMVASADLSGTYQPFSATGLPQACFLLRIINGSTAPITISYDGTTDNDFIQGSSTFEIAAQTNAQPSNWVALFAKGQLVYVKGTMGDGDVYLTGYYVS